MGFKRLWMLGISAILLFSIVGCGGNGNNNTANDTGGNANSPSASDTSQKTEKEALKPVTFTIFHAGTQVKNVESNQTEIGKILEDQTGVNWKMEYPVGDVKTKIGTMIASGDYPDVLAPDTEIDKVVDAGGFIPLNDLIDQYGPNIKRVYEPYYNQMRNEDGNIYFLPFSPVVGEYIPNPNIDQGAFWIQRRVLKEAGYPKIKTLDEYLNLIEQFMNNHKGEGLKGLTALTFDWRTMGIFNPPNHLSGYPNDGDVIVDMNTHKVDDYGDNDVTKRWLKAVNAMNAKGMFDQSAFVNNYDQYLAELTSGKVLGFFDYGWEFNQASQNLQKAAVADPAKDDLRYFPLPIVFDDNIKDQYLDPPSFINNRGVGITTSAKDPVRIIQFFDNMLKEENQVLVQWGIKGETYEVDDNGRFYMTQEQINQNKDNAFKEKVGLTYFQYGWPMYGQGSTLSDGNSYVTARQPEVAQASFTDGDNLILGKYGVQTFAQMFAAPDDRPWYPAWSLSLESGSPAQIFTQRRTELKKKYFPKMVLAKPDDFDGIWDEYYKEYNKLDVKVYEDTMNTLIADKIKRVTGQ